MGWGDVQGRGSGESVQENHLQITPNTTKVIHVLLEEGKEPISFWSHFIPEAGEKGRTVICPGRGKCPVCRSGQYRTRRQHALNVYDYESKSVKILETGNQLMQQLNSN